MALRINQTGIRDGEKIMGAPGQKQCAGTVMQVRGMYPPSKPWVEKLVPEQIRDRFNNFRFFQSLPPEQRWNWLLSNSTLEADLYLEDVPNLQVKFLEIGGEFILKALSQVQIDLLRAGNPSDPEGWWPIQTVYNMFPRKPGSKAKHHTLVFRPSNWTLVEDGIALAETHSGCVIHLESGSCTVTSVARSQFPGYYLIQGNPEIVIVRTLVGPNEITFARMEPIAASLEVSIEKMREIKAILDWASPSVHKSLIQKILRTRCTQVEWVGTNYPAKEVLATSFSMLISHPGAFVPSIQKFTTGCESALKRLAVAICEDAFLENPAILTSLFAGAWIAQNHPKTEWGFSDDLLRIWLSYGLKALEYPVQFEYDWHSIPDGPLQLPAWNPLWANYVLLNRIQSFDSDVKMVASIAQNNGRPTTFQDLRTERIMPLVHCIDQHSFTDIAHYLPYSILQSIGSYSDLFKLIWQQVVGVNPRQPKFASFDFMQGDEFFTLIRGAQTLIWLSRAFRPISQPASEAKIDIVYTLDPSWLAAFIGSAEIKVGSATAMVMMNPDDLHAFSAVRRPSRDKDTAELTETEKMTVIESFKQSLRQGRPLANVPSTLSMFQGATVFLVEDSEPVYYLQFGSTRYRWEDLRHLRLQFPVHPDIGGSDTYLYTALTQTGDGIREHAVDHFAAYLQTVPVAVLQRGMQYLGYSTVIDLHHIGRDGNGVSYMVTIEDTGVNHLLAAIAALFPAALMKDGSKYKVKSGPLMWWITDQIKSILPRISSSSLNVWPMPKPDPRQLWEHQIDSIRNLMETRHRKRARILVANVGLGKTSILANYIATLIRENRMNPYCLYTLPPSAMKTVVAELTLLGLPVYHLDARQSSDSVKELVPGRITIVWHDHLRMLDLERIKVIAPQMLFIVDEFHKTMNATKRTSTALEIAHLSDDVIALTGTICKDNKIEPIIAWLEMAANFEVTTSNYWVALSSIIASRVETKVVVERVIQEAPMNSEEQAQYYGVVPSGLGGTAHKIDFRAALAISYSAVTRQMIEMILYHLQMGLGCFVVARNIAHQHEIRDLLASKGVTSVYLIGSGHILDLTPQNISPENNYAVTITHPGYAEGYNATRYRILITAVYLSNQATRTQLEGRINRLSQTAPSIRIVVIHAGILSYIFRHYEHARRLADAMKGLAKEVGIDPADLRDA